MTELVDLPEDTLNIFFVVKKKQIHAVFFDSYSWGADTYQMLFRILKNYDISPHILAKIIRISDGTICDLKRVDDHVWYTACLFPFEPLLLFSF